MGEERLACASIGGTMTDEFAAFYRQQYPGAVRLAWLLLHDHGLGEDVVQEAFVRMRSRFDEVTNRPAYLRRSVINGCRDGTRSTERSRRRLRLVRAGSPTSTTDRPAELSDIVSRLPYKQRAVIVLRYWADLPESEIAVALGVRPSTVRTLASRGLEALRKEIPDGQ